MKRIIVLAVVVLCGCSGTNFNVLSHLNSGTCGQLGGVVGLLTVPANAIAPVAGTAAAVAVCDALAGFFTQPNTLTGSVEMPVKMQNMELTVANPQQFACPSNMTCTPK